MLARHAKRYSAMHARKLASPLDCAELANIRSACKTATMNDPKQMDPKDVVMVRKNELLMADPQHPDSDGSYLQSHQGGHSLGELRTTTMENQEHSEQRTTKCQQYQRQSRERNTA